MDFFLAGFIMLVGCDASDYFVEGNFNLKASC